MVFIGGTPAEVVIHLSRRRASPFRNNTGAWESPDHFVVTPRRVGLLKWRRLRKTAMMHALSALIKGAREMRLAHYRACTVCDKPHPPEVLADDDVCPSCSGSVALHRALTE